MLLNHYEKITTVILTSFILLFFIAYSVNAAVLKEEDKGKILKKVQSLQVPFIENKGQIGKGVLISNYESYCMTTAKNGQNSTFKYSFFIMSLL